MEYKSPASKSMCRFFGLSKAWNYAAIAMAVLATVLLVYGIIEQQKPHEPAVKFTHETTSGEYVYIDLCEVPDWVFTTEQKHELTHYYAGLNTDGTVFLLVLAHEKYKELTSELGNNIGFMPSSSPDSASKFTRIYGATHVFSTEDIEYISSCFEITSDEFVTNLGSHYIIEGEVPPSSRAQGYAIYAVLLLVPMVIIFVRLQKRKKSYANSIDRLCTLGMENQIEQEFDMPGIVCFPAAKLCFSKHYIYWGSGSRSSLYYGGRIIAYADVYWLFVNQVGKSPTVVNPTLYAGLSDGTFINLADRNVTDDFVQNIAKIVRGQNPDVLLGCSDEISEKYRSRLLK